MKICRILVVCMSVLIILANFLVPLFLTPYPALGEELSRSNRDHLRERIESEIKFSRGLVKLYPEQEKTWGKLISDARSLISGIWERSSLEDCYHTVQGAEKILSPIGEAAKTYTIYCVGHAHIDMNWMWSWPETVAVTNDTFTTVLKLMEEFPDFCFTQSQASVYKIMKDYNPEYFEQIKKRINEGRWEIAAVHWVEGDKNLASGESLARHLLYTRRFVEENFGLKPEEVTLDWEPDTFGHALTIPAVVSRAGVKFYYMCRGGKFEKPPIFWWQSPDGSRILVNLETTWYNSSIGPHNATELLEFTRKTGLKDWMKVYGVGDHGGGPTRRDIMYCLEMNTWPIFPNFKMSTARNYFVLIEKYKDKFPVLKQELNFEFTGCYTSQSQIKKFNRLGENQAVEAETAAALAYMILGREYPAEKLRDAWINILFGHFHDILPGSGVRETREYQSGLFQESAAALSMIKSNSLKAITEKIDTSFSDLADVSVSTNAEKGRTMGAGAGRGASEGYLSSAVHQKPGGSFFVVFNPSTWPRREVIQVTVWDTGENSIRENAEKDYIVRTSSGEILPAQKVRSGDYWGHQYIDMAVPVSIDPLGYRTYLIEENRDLFNEISKKWENQVKVLDQGFENKYLLVRFDRMSGGISHLIDKKTGADLADPKNPMGLLEYILERPGSMSAWVIHDPKKSICPLELESFRVSQNNGYLAAVQAKVKLNQSDLTVTYTLKADEPWVEIDVETFWLEQGTEDSGIPKLRMVFPVNLTNTRSRYEIPFGSIERDLNQGQEVPGLRWANVSGEIPGTKTRGNLLLLNDCKYGHSLDGSTLGLTLLRSSYSPDPLPEFGHHSMRMAVVPIVGEIDPSDMVRFGASFNHPMQIIYTDAHQGSLPAKVEHLVLCEPKNIIISGFKKAEEGEGLILRIFETDGKKSRAVVKLNLSLLGEIESVEEVDLLERPLSSSAARATASGFEVDVPAFGIASVWIKFKKEKAGDPRRDWSESRDKTFLPRIPIF